MTQRTIQPLSFGEDTIYIEVSEVQQQGKSNDEFEDVSAIDQVKDAGVQIQGTIRALSRNLVKALEDSDPVRQAKLVISDKVKVLVWEI